MTTSSAIFLLLLSMVMSNVIPSSTAFQMPLRAAPPGFVSNLIQRAKSRDSSHSRTGSRMTASGSKRLSFLPESRQLEPESSSEPQDLEFFWWTQCYGPDNPDRTISLAGDFIGKQEEFMYIDSEYDLILSSSSSLETSEIGKLRDRAFQHFRQQFGLSVNLSEFSPHPDGYNVSQSGMIFAPIVFNVSLRAVADSSAPSPCADRTALVGGWALSAENVTVRGTLGGVDGIFYEGHSIFTVLYVVTDPGTEHRERAVFFPLYPVNCGRDGSCVLSGPFKKDNKKEGIENEDDADDSNIEVSLRNEDENTSVLGTENVGGWIDGSSVTYHLPGMEYQQILRLVAMWPGRFYPIAGYDYFID